MAHAPRPATFLANFRRSRGYIHYGCWSFAFPPFTKLFTNLNPTLCWLGSPPSVSVIAEPIGVCNIHSLSNQFLPGSQVRRIAGLYWEALIGWHFRTVQISSCSNLSDYTCNDVKQCKLIVSITQYDDCCIINLIINVMIVIIMIMVILFIIITTMVIVTSSSSSPSLSSSASWLSFWYATAVTLEQGTGISQQCPCHVSGLSGKMKREELEEDNFEPTPKWGSSPHSVGIGIGPSPCLTILLWAVTTKKT